MEKRFAFLFMGMLLLFGANSIASDVEAANYSCKHSIKDEADVWEIVDKTDSRNQIGGAFLKQSDCQSALQLALHDPDDLVCTPAGPLNKFFRLFDLDGGEPVGSWNKSCATATAERERAKKQPASTDTSALKTGTTPD